MISMLQLIFDEVPAPKQIEVIHVLNCATEFPELGNFEGRYENDDSRKCRGSH